MLVPLLPANLALVQLHKHRYPTLIPPITLLILIRDDSQSPRLECGLVSLGFLPPGSSTELVLGPLLFGIEIPLSRLISAHKALPAPPLLAIPRQIFLPLAR